eukprot:6325560-Prymnesium_polylepis.1
MKSETGPDERASCLLAARSSAPVSRFVRSPRRARGRHWTVNSTTDINIRPPFADVTGTVDTRACVPPLER